MKIPRHVAIIMDGNGRWARSQGLPRVRGHEAGAESVREIVRASRELGVEVLTLYSFSTENWRRPADEVTALMGLLKRYVFQERAEILDNGIQLRAIGQIERLPAFVRVPLKRLIRDSRRNTGMVLNLALSYGSRAEMLAAVAYAEIYITDIPWPEFRRPQLEEAFASFGDRERRFGKTGEQVQAGGGRA
jgi:undecaprenyl diphosphate synthase